MKAMIEVIKSNADGYCFRIGNDGGIEKINGMTTHDTKLFGITITRRIKWAFVSELRVLGFPISRSHIQGWEGSTSQHP
ncbi:hypothetical protein [uncultured Alistipes sp.]|uniref:hypothetical protein n=1 Tax=uncultured Alistipes sp. TaxID=538949 RepID=UPI001A1C1C25|nr:hypothetical protein [uncultured Alistipes sp.]MBJ2189109.1 hypothetical protein [Muribaculaceae bacterium]